MKKSERLRAWWLDKKVLHYICILIFAALSAWAFIDILGDIIEVLGEFV